MGNLEMSKLTFLENRKIIRELLGFEVCLLSYF